jgi:hypothetical protein
MKRILASPQKNFAIFGDFALFGEEGTHFSGHRYPAKRRLAESKKAPMTKRTRQSIGATHERKSEPRAAPTSACSIVLLNKTALSFRLNGPHSEPLAIPCFPFRVGSTHRCPHGAHDHRNGSLFSQKSISQPLDPPALAAPPRDIANASQIAASARLFRPWFERLVQSGPRASSNRLICQTRSKFGGSPDLPWPAMDCGLTLSKSPHFRTIPA